MSYWYERFVKKHVIVLLLSLPVLLVSGAFQLLISYVSGCVPTASRTLYDWMSPERSFNSFEVYPFVALYIDTGCIEWLGFSTCETVQFNDWMPIWTQNEVDTIHIMNISGGQESAEGHAVQQTEVAVEMERKISNNGITATLGQILLNRKIEYKILNTETLQLDQLIVTAGPVGSSGESTTVTSPWKKFRLGELLGVTPGAMVFYDSAKQTQEKLTLPAALNRKLKEKSLYFFLETRYENERCTFDDDCKQQCSWNGRCEPQEHGHQGTLMPSATLFMDFKSALELNHWPDPAWNHQRYCPRKNADCVDSEWDLKAINVLHAETLSLMKFENLMDTTSERFPDVELHSWRAAMYQRRDEACQAAVVDQPGKDCGVDPDYAFAMRGLFVSFPSPGGGAAKVMPEILSEKVTGLRMDYLSVWQINRRLQTQSADGGNKDWFLPLFRVARRPSVLKIDEKLQFASFKGYAEQMLLISILSAVMYPATNFLFLAIFFYGATCVEYCKENDKRNAPFQVSYGD